MTSSHSEGVVGNCNCILLEPDCIDGPIWLFQELWLQTAEIVVRDIVTHL